MSRSPSFLALLLCVCAGSVGAQGQTVPAPVNDARPPALEVIDDSVEPQVTIRKRGEDMVEEYRVNGVLVKVVVTPEHGVPYTLIDPKGNGVLVPFDPTGTQISVPLWEIGNF